jgi:para-nitrobenzyl esterase
MTTLIAIRRGWTEAWETTTNRAGGSPGAGVRSGSRRHLLMTLAITCMLLAPGSGASALSSQAQDPVRGVTVMTTDGSVRGVRIGAADAFLGLPYAAPPVKDLRFAPPAPVTPWSGVRDASRQGPACLQFQPGGVRETQATSEDCLYLDVYRPEGLSRSARLPVMMWIHGGGYTQGTGVIYGGQTLAARTHSVVVSINYRVGALGYLALSQLDRETASTGSGNWGLLDQIGALKWIRRNVATFGGDAGNVTIAGQSAGGSSVCALLASPKAAGLFERATIQSAYCGLGERSLTDAQAQGDALAKQAGCTDLPTRVACLRRAWAPNLVAAFQTAASAGPVTGTPVLPAGSTQAISSDHWNKVPVIIGATAHEGRLFLSATPNLTPADYQTWLNSFGSNAAKVEARYPLTDFASPFDAQAQAFGDSFIYCATDRTATLLAARTPVFRYEFDDPNSPTLYGFQPEGIDMSSTHSAELAYLFDFTLGASPIPPSSDRLARQIKSYWGSFASDANPNGGGLPYWAQYDAATHRTLVLRPDGPRMTTTAGQKHHCDFWANPDEAS